MAAKMVDHIQSILPVDQGIELANASDYGLTAGFYGAASEVAVRAERQLKLRVQAVQGRLGC